jgi:hypothetical protein
VRRRVVITLLVLGAIAAPPSAGAGAAEDMPTCRFGLAAGDGAHVLRFRSRCEFEQTSIQIGPTGKLSGVSAETTIGGRADPGDGFMCSREEGTVACAGRAGEGARVEGRFRTRRPACEVSANALISGGVDCEAGEACIDIAYIGAFEVRKPKGC